VHPWSLHPSLSLGWILRINEAVALDGYAAVASSQGWGREQLLPFLENKSALLPSSLSYSYCPPLTRFCFVLLSLLSQELNLLLISLSLCRFDFISEQHRVAAPLPTSAPVPAVIEPLRVTVTFWRRYQL
jgi:hypothetical protein